MPLQEKEKKEKEIKDKLTIIVKLMFNNNVQDDNENTKSLLYFKNAVQIMRDIHAKHNLDNISYYNIKAVYCVAYVKAFLEYYVLFNFKMHTDIGPFCKNINEERKSKTDVTKV